jgi:hypothetical protein
MVALQVITIPRTLDELRGMTVWSVFHPPPPQHELDSLYDKVDWLTGADELCSSLRIAWDEDVRCGLEPHSWTTMELIRHIGKLPPVALVRAWSLLMVSEPCSIEFARFIHGHFARQVLDVFDTKGNTRDDQPG